MPAVADYLSPDLPSGLARVTMPVVDATPAALEGYGRLVDDPASCAIEIVRRPARGSRPVDPDAGEEGVFATRGTQRFFDRQGAVHARVSVDFAREFGCLLEAPIS